MYDETTRKRGGSILQQAAIWMTALLLYSQTQFACASPQLQSNTPVSTAGYFTLSWEDESTGNFELQRAPNDRFDTPVTLYRGPDKATVVSGLANGDYFYRVRGIESNSGGWSDPVKVTVAHHPLSRAFLFFTLGAIMFLITITVLIRGARRSDD
jgi:hypothetical protein